MDKITLSCIEEFLFDHVPKIFHKLWIQYESDFRNPFGCIGEQSMFQCFIYKLFLIDIFIQTKYETFYFK